MVAGTWSSTCLERVGARARRSSDSPEQACMDLCLAGVDRGADAQAPPPRRLACYLPRPPRARVELQGQLTPVMLWRAAQRDQHVELLRPAETDRTPALHPNARKVLDEMHDRGSKELYMMTDGPCGNLTVQSKWSNVRLVWPFPHAMWP